MGGWQHIYYLMQVVV